MTKLIGIFPGRIKKSSSSPSKSPNALTPPPGGGPSYPATKIEFKITPSPHSQPCTNRRLRHQLKPQTSPGHLTPVVLSLQTMRTSFTKSAWAAIFFRSRGFRRFRGGCRWRWGSTWSRLGWRLLLRRGFRLGWWFGRGGWRGGCKWFGLVDDAS